ncbi:hypothetical protein XFF6992_460102 [Xanthomonas citri pv. fuscans]|nr:hypothetical protein XFF6992_460102 [Xanthomonas citri pv. fuscans]SOO34692.1 hypothetical protein XFF6994_4490005 [Xanthomonas citri pv. fuscans]
MPVPNLHLGHMSRPLRAATRGVQVHLADAACTQHPSTHSQTATSLADHLATAQSVPSAAQGPHRTLLR